MKKITNSILPLFLLLGVGACGTKEDKENKTDPAQVIAQVTEVIGIGKILPAEGIISIASVKAGMVEKIAIHAGDTVKQGDLLIQLRSQEEQLTASQSRAQLATQQATNKATAFDVELAQTKLDELYKKYQTSKNLAQKGAETQEIVISDSSSYIQQQYKLAQARQQLNASQKTLQELLQQVKITELNVADKKINAPADGVILDMDVTIGQTLEPNVAFAQMAPAGELVVECEVDELYANKVRRGQRVVIYPTNHVSPLAEGVITYVGASLQDKSILYEKVGEGTDRRVRRATVAISKKNTDLLINDKVECKILLN